MKQLLCLLAVIGCWAWAWNTRGLGWARTETIAVSEVQPGMKGYGLSVFQGTRPERFPVEVIDVLYNFRPGQDLILVRTPHPILDRTQSVAGMSGSPIFLSGRLAGAYAYGWPFGTEPIVGVTPIATMLAELSRPIDPMLWEILGPPPTRAGAQQARKLAFERHRDAVLGSAIPPYLGGPRRDASFALSAANKSRLPSTVGMGTGPTPAQTPLMLAGFSDDVARMLAPQLEPLGLVPLQVGSTGAAVKTVARPAAQTAPFEDGSAIGVELIRGDVSATSVGTVTHVMGNQLVGFGHPMMNAGQTAMPTTTAEVIHVLASLQRSFKMARPVTSVGTMTQDRQATIVVDTELLPEVIPVQLTVHDRRMMGVGADSPSAPKRTWNLEVASHRELTPMLVFAGLANAIRATAADRADAVFTARTRLRIKDHGELRFTDMGHMPSGPSSGSDLARLRVFNAIEAVYGNPFERTYITGLEIELEIEFSDHVAVIDDLQAPIAEVEAGATVELQVVVRDFNGGRRVVTTPVQIPENAAGTTVELSVASGGAVQPEIPRPRNLQDMLDSLSLSYPTTSLVVAQRLPSQGARLRGHVLRQLPGSVLATLKTTTIADQAPVFFDQQRVEIPLGQVVYGDGKVTLNVKEPSP